MIDLCCFRNRSLVGEIARRASITLGLHTILLGLAVTRSVAGAEDQPEQADQALLRLDTGGPTSWVTSLAFDRDSQTLYAGGWDKVVQAWSRNAANEFRPDSRKSIRVPVGPGLDGAINATVVSPDGRFVAIAGRGVVEGAAGFRQSGRMTPSIGGMTDEMKLDQGTIYVMDRETRAVHSLPGHTRPVLSLMFSPDSRFLVSAAGNRLEERPAVVRLWNVEKAVHVKGIFVDGIAEQDVQTRPQLAVRRAGNGPTDLQIVIAWNQGSFYVWDVSKNHLRPSPSAGLWNKTAAFLPDNQQLVTGGFRWNGVREGVLGLWRFRADGTLDPTRQSLALPSVNGLFCQPQALAVWSANGRSYAAVACHLLRPGNKLKQTSMELQLIDLERRLPVARVPLWQIDEKTTVRLPALAASPDGEWLAASGGPHHIVSVFRVTDLLQRRSRAQELRSQASQVSQARFVRRGDTRGMYFKEGTTPLIFDLDTHELTAYRKNSGWWLDEPRSAGWDVKAEKRNVMVRDPQGRLHAIPFPSEANEVTWKVLLPPGRNRPTPLLAMASHTLGQPTLGLYNAASGEQLRQYTGYTERIRGLSFSQDGRLLISTGNDHTLRVWSLTDVADVIGQRGMLKGIAVKDHEDGGVVVARVEPDSPLREQLSTGDRLLGYLDRDELRTWANASEYYDFWWRLKPDQKVTVRRERSGGQQDIVLVASQGIDERKPLFSFFLAQPVAGRARQWIGWSPLGPFESSDEQIEQYLGWHFNTGDPERPASFVDLNQHRMKYYRRGLLKQLVVHGALQPEGDDKPLDPPEMSVSILDVQPDPESGEDHLIQQTDVTFELEVGLPVDKMAKVECHFDGASAGEMHLTSDRLWAFDLSEARWERGFHSVKAVVHTNERRPQTFGQSMVVRYQPSAPRIRLVPETLASAKRVTVDADENEFELRAEIVPRSEKEPVVVGVYVLSEEKREAIAPPLQFSEPRSIEQTVPLKIGANYVQIVARNANAVGESANYETNVETLTVVRAAKAVPLEIAAHVVDARKVTENVKFSEIVRVNSSRPEVSGTVTAGETPTMSILQLQGAEAVRTSIDVTKSPQAGSFEFSHKMDPLDPRTRRTVILFVDSQKTMLKWQFDLEYEPPLPQVEILEPTGGSRSVVIDQQQTVEVSARLRFPPGIEVPAAVMEKLRASVHVNDDRGHPVTVNPLEQTLEARVPVALGANEIRFRLHYEWQNEQVSESEIVSVWGHERPRARSLKVINTDDGREVVFELDKVATGISEIYVDRHILPRDAWIVDYETATVSGRVKLAPETPDETWETLVVHVAGLPGRPFKFHLPPPTTVPSPQPPPDLQFISPTPDETTSRDTHTVRFLVSSSSPISRVELRHQKSAALVLEGQNLRARLTRKTNRFEFEGSTPVRLNVGLNTFELIAHNEVGPHKISTTLSCIPPPVRVTFDGLMTDDGEWIEFRKQAADSTVEVDDPLVTVRGRVIWSRNSRDPRRKDKWQSVRVTLDGFQHFGQLQAAQDGFEREFSIPVLLSKSHGVLQIDVPELELDISDTMSYHIRCHRPSARYRVHLLIVGVGKTDGETMVAAALTALDGKRSKHLPDVFRTDVFGTGRIRGPLTGDLVSAATVTTELQRIGRQIRRSGTRARDVVILYYSGGELVPREHEFILTTKPHQNSATTEDTIQSQRLKRFVAGTPGAHLILLDVSRHCEPLACPPSTWPVKSHGAMLRYAWLKPDVEQTKETRLMSALQNIDPVSDELGEFDSDLERQFKKLLERGLPLIYDRHVPEAMKTLKLR